MGGVDSIGSPLPGRPGIESAHRHRFAIDLCKPIQGSALILLQVAVRWCAFHLAFYLCDRL